MHNGQFHNRQFIILTTGKIAGLLLTFAIPMFLSRFLTRDDYGIYAQFNMFEGLFAGVLNLAMGSGIYYFYARLNKRQLCAVAGNCYVTYAVLCLIGYLFLRWTPCGGWVMGNSPVISIMNLLFIAAFCTMCSQLMIPLYIVSQDNNIALFYPSLEIIVRCLATIVIACIIGGLKGVIAGILVARGLMLLFATIYMLLKRHGWYSQYTAENPGEEKYKWYNTFFDFDVLKSQLRYTLPLTVSAMLGCIIRRIDKLICISWMDSAEYAVYVVAFLAIPGIAQVQSSIAEVCLTGMSKCFKENDPAGALQLLKQLEYKALSFSTPMVFAAFLYADHIITLIYSEKYIDSVPYFRAFMFTTLFEIIASGLITRASGHTRISAVTGIINFAVVLPLTFVLVKYFGAWGGVTSVITASLVQRLAYTYYEIKIVDATWKTYLPWEELGKIFAISTLCLIPIAALRYFYNFNIVISGLLAIVYIITVYYLEIRRNIFIIDFNSAANYCRKIFCKIKLS